MSRLKNVTVVVTGASSGIGKGLALALAREGANLALAARSEERLQAVAREATALGAEVLSRTFDITSEPGVEGFFAAIKERFGGVDTLINNAGSYREQAIDDMLVADWNEIMGACLTGTFLCTREAFRLMKPRRKGRIINIGSISAKRTRLNMAPYTAAKAGVWGLTQASALEGRPFGIAVGCVHPGNVGVEKRLASGANMDDEPMVSVPEISNFLVEMVCLPNHVNVLETTILPTQQIYVGRG